MIRYLAFLIVLPLCFWGCTPQATVFDLGQGQSMLMVGKGPGQDGAINPYQGTNSRAVVKNLGKTTLSVRVRTPNEEVRNLPVAPADKIIVALGPADQLFLDGDYNQAGKAKVSFRPGE